MQGMISSVNVTPGGQGGDVDRYLKIVFDLSNITPVPVGEPPYVRYSYSYTGYPSCYTVDSLGNEDEVSLSEVLHYYLIPIASNDEENTGVTCEFDGLMCEGVIRSATNNLQSATFYFQWYVDLNQDYLIIRNNLTYREPQVTPTQEQEKYINTLIDLTGITPTTETVNGKSYNKFTFTPNELDVWTLTNDGQLEAIPLSDMRNYKTFPISSNNNDMGLYMTYDGTNFSGYVLSQESSLTDVSFMFDFYTVILQSGFTWKNYVDLFFFNPSGSGTGGGLKIYEQSGTFTVPQNVTSLKVTLIGGGGAGGHGYRASAQSYYRAGGNGGGSGYQVIDREISVIPGNVYIINVGHGGQPTDTGTKSEDGFPSSIYSNGIRVIEVSGGGGGGHGSSNASTVIGRGFVDGRTAYRTSSGDSSGGVGGSGDRTINDEYFTFNCANGGDGGIGSYPGSPGDGYNDGKPGDDGVVIICWGGVSVSDLGIIG